MPSSGRLEEGKGEGGERRARGEERGEERERREER
jgi:hypothetical protein